MKRSLYGLAIFIALGASPVVHGATFNVAPNGGPDCNTGTCDLQSALDAADSNDENDTLNLSSGVYHAAGTAFTYTPAPTENKSLTVVGAGSGQTILDGDGLSQVFTVDTSSLAADSDADIAFQDVSFVNGSHPSGGGAGLFVGTTGADIRIERCAFEFNKGAGSGSSPVSGGGLFAASLAGGSVFVTNSQFSHNTLGGDTSAGAGSFTATVQGQVVLEGNTYLDNSALFTQMEGIAGGAAVFSVLGDVIVNRNLFLRNSAGAGGGGVFAASTLGSVLITNNVMANNLLAVSFLGTTSGTTPGGGAGIFVAVEGPGSITLTNNTITENEVLGGDGGGAFVALAVDQSEATLFNNIIWGNKASGGVICSTSCNDILVDDDTEKNNVGSDFTLSHSDFSDIFFTCDVNAGCTPNRNVDAGTNLDVDPLFVNSLQNDFHLLDISPLIDKGDPLAPGIPSNDLDGEARIQGFGPDLGAYESAGPPELCANNVDDDGDLKVDCLDPDCAGSDACQGTPPPGSENCANNLDDDGDGLTDCGDPNCKGAVACRDTENPPSTGSESCTNNVDDDGDGLIDCNDPDCGSVCGFDNNPPTTPNISVNGGCTLSAGGGSPIFLLGLMAPLLLAAWRIRRR